MSIDNKHGVAIDVQTDSVFVSRPPTSLTGDEALSFCAWLVATANSALLAKKEPANPPAAFGGRVMAACSRRSSGDITSRGVCADGSGGVVLVRRMTLLTPGEALDLAAELMAATDPHADIVAVVNAVVDYNRGGRAMSDVLAGAGHTVELSEPHRREGFVRHRLDAEDDGPETETSDAEEKRKQAKAK